MRFSKTVVRVAESTRDYQYSEHSAQVRRIYNWSWVIQSRPMLCIFQFLGQRMGFMNIEQTALALGAITNGSPNGLSIDREPR